ncbi:hypothetical protein ACWEGQ_00010 [Streptomyces seoulensis]
MTCEDTTTAMRLSWEIQAYEPYSQVWICHSYGRTTTTAAPADVARAVLTGHLTTQPAHTRQTYRAVAHTDACQPVIVTANDCKDSDGWEAGPEVYEALPHYLREALPASG